MTMVEAMTRMEQIQTTLVQLSGARAAATTATAAQTSGATAFAQALTLTAGAAPSGSTGLATGSATGGGVVAAAEKYLGVPYVFGGESRSGMDCSGLVQRVYADVGVAVPRLVSGQMKIGTPVASLADAKPGDLIVTKGGEHIVIYAGNNKIIHAPYPGRQVCLRDNYLKDSDIETIRRVVPAEAAVVAAPASPATADLLSAALASLATGGSR
jgi:cell wall-associated NlpC family hydrolase